MSWLYLLTAGLFEIGWPIGIKIAQDPGHRILGMIMAGLCIALSGGFMWLAQRGIPMGTAYAVWTGIGAAGTFCVGVWIYGDPTSLGRSLGVLLIIAGVALLRLSA
jgi:quaternary ammonium compound-resistance protein SugE